ncbi:MAG: hypothetical protein A2Y10_17530 [Planctomycetes bacterium GWF2_41_51]|nr:MAG: hypothetical protein A2Y10_17530 [Planctomycetes bacterium GWF2_41_51]HBG28028.1 hypothetical protein [Phycisphaerales bacterium]
MSARKITIFLMSQILLMCIVSIQAATVYEFFDYPTGSIAGRTGGAGWGSNAWYLPGATDPNYAYGTEEIVANSLVFSDYPATGGALKLVCIDPTAFTKAIAVRRQMGTNFTNGNDLWISYLAKADPALTDFVSRIAELRHGTTIGNCNFRMSAKMFDFQGIRVSYDSAGLTTDNTQNSQDGRTYLYIAKFDNLGSASGDGAVMWVLDEDGYDSAMADGILTEDDLETYYYLKAADPQVSRSMTTDFSALIICYARSFGYYFDEIRYGYSLQEVNGGASDKLASEPTPMDNAVNVMPAAVLKWKSGSGVVTNGHKVYLGTDLDAVTNATPANPLGVYKGAYDVNYFDPGVLAIPNVRYYWRVDEETSTATFKGYIWSFTTFSELSVDDFEAYTDTTSLLSVWEDYHINNSGATLDLSVSQHHNGLKSMKYTYESAYGESIASMQFDEPQDWSVDGALRVMDVWFAGTAGNSTAETMFVRISDSSSSDSVYYPYSSHFTDPAWKVWHINMSDFSGIDLTDVQEFEIGFTDGGDGYGFVYFDDIVIYPCRPGSLVTDVNGDCVVNLEDLAIFAQEWLQTKLY